MIGSIKSLALALALTAIASLAAPARADHVGFTIGVGANVRPAIIMNQPIYGSSLATPGFYGPPVPYFAQPATIYWGGGYYPYSYGYGGYNLQQQQPLYYMPGGVNYAPVPPFNRPQPRLTFGVIGRW